MPVWCACFWLCISHGRMLLGCFFLLPAKICLGDSKQVLFSAANNQRLRRSTQSAPHSGS
ncbi:unnamed protein product [Mycena citricolor]|uniref:Uncharacterized protein n=1 Tax=Mycena citricolor TaxID=2018698 RepID=A0AAD2HQJ1_9AGAR|nr:unnamed protein product [Mycena citricolor]